MLGQIYLAFYLDKPSEAKNTKTIVFGDSYDHIFDEATITARRMLVPYKVYLPINEMKKEIQRKKRRRLPISEKDAFVSRATFHILSAVKHIADKQSLDLDNETDVREAIRKAIGYVGEVTSAERKRRKELYTHDKFFKEIQTNSVIQKYVLDRLSESAPPRKSLKVRIRRG